MKTNFVAAIEEESDPATLDRVARLVEQAKDEYRERLKREASVK